MTKPKRCPTCWSSEPNRRQGVENWKSGGIDLCDNDAFHDTPASEPTILCYCYSCGGPITDRTNNMAVTTVHGIVCGECDSERNIPERYSCYVGYDEQADVVLNIRLRPTSPAMWEKLRKGGWLTLTVQAETADFLNVLRTANGRDQRGVEVLIDET